MMIGRNMSIKRKLIMIVMASCITTLLLAGLVVLIVDWSTARREMVHDVGTHAEMIAENCKASIVFDEARDATETLKSLRVTTPIILAAIIKADGTLFASYQRDPPANGLHKPRLIPPAETLGRSTHNFTGPLLDITRPIILDDQTIATVYVRSDSSIFQARLTRSIRILIIIIASCIVVAYLISSRLQRIVSGPVLDLAHLARTVSQEPDYARRAVKKTDDEVGALIDAFNEMLHQIQLRDEKLVHAKQSLETRVHERTKELSAANTRLTAEVDERQKAEESLRTLNKELLQTNQQLREFTYIASHDLREPTRKITSFGQLLRESLADRLDADDLENLNFMIDGAERMRQMIEALLTYSRVSTREIEFTTLDLNELLAQLQRIELAVPLEDTKGRILIPHHLPPIEADPAQIRQLMQNLLANALKYRNKDIPPEIVVRARHAEDRMVRVEVTDNGIGIPPDQQQNVFVMFRRLHPRDQYEGTGIGLAVCKRIVERHKGRIAVESTPGQGSTFYFTVPAASPKTENNEPVSASSGAQT